VEEEDRAGEEGKTGWAVQQEGRRGWAVEEEDRAGEEGSSGWAGGSPIRPDTSGCTDLGQEISTWAVQCYK
jgi:hypothetical protein